MFCNDLPPSPARTDFNPVSLHDTKPKKRAIVFAKLFPFRGVVSEGRNRANSPPIWPFGRSLSGTLHTPIRTVVTKDGHRYSHRLLPASQLIDSSQPSGLRGFHFFGTILSERTLPPFAFIAQQQHTKEELICFNLKHIRRLAFFLEPFVVCIHRGADGENFQKPRHPSLSYLF